MVVKLLSKEGRHLKSRAAPDRASASNGLTDGYHCSTCLSTSLTITSLSTPRSPSSLYPFILLTNSYQGLHLHDQPKVLLCSKSLHFLFLLPPPPSSDLFQKCTFTTFFSKTLFPVKLCRQVNCRILNTFPTHKVNNHLNDAKERFQPRNK